MTLYSNFEIDEILEKRLISLNVHIPTYNIFKDNDAIQIEERSYVNDDLIPVIEYKITINKESLHRHQFEWKEVFNHHYQKVLSNPPNWDFILLQSYTIKEIVERFRKYLIAPLCKLQEEILNKDSANDNQ